MRKFGIILGIIVFSVLVVPLLASLPSATAVSHKGPIPFPGNLVPHPDPSNHHYIGKHPVVIPTAPVKNSPP